MHALEARLRAQTAGQWGSGIVVGDEALEAAGGDAGSIDRPSAVPGTQYAGAELTQLPDTHGLDPATREGLGRPQSHRIAMSLADEYADEPALSGQHGEIAAQIRIPRDTQLPWEASPEASWRDIPQPVTAGAPGGCE